MNHIALHLIRQDIEHQKAKLDWLLKQIELLEQKSQELRQTIEAGERFLTGTNGNQR